MSRSLLLACCLVALNASAAPPSPVPKATAAAKPVMASAHRLTLAQVVERNVAAHGGLVAWRAVTSLTVGGQLDAGGKANVQLPFVIKMKRPHKSRVEITFRDQTALQVYDGSQGWKVRPFLGRNEVEPYTPAEAKAATSWEELDGPLIDHVAKGTRVELLGTEAVEEHDAYKLLLTFKSGAQRNLWVDTSTFLELKLDGEPRKLDGKVHKVAIFYRAFKTENGLTMPRQLETVVEGFKQTRKMDITRVTFNEVMPDTLFQKPRLAMAQADAPQ
jgi:outer membrane lipoprotein-sorting protein